MELLIRYRSHQKWYSKTNRVTYTQEEGKLYTAARENVKEVMKSNLAVNIGNPGDMVTGSAFQTFSSDFGRNFLCSLVKEEIREVFGQILLGLCTLVKVVNSQKRQVNVDKVRQLGKQVYLQLVQTFPWAMVSPSVHRILAHSWEVIQLNDEYGLGGESEEGLEALNKNIRRMRSTGARKDSTLNNFTDVQCAPSSVGPIQTDHC